MIHDTTNKIPLLFSYKSPRNAPIRLTRQLGHSIRLFSNSSISLIGNDESSSSNAVVPFKYPSPSELEIESNKLIKACDGKSSEITEQQDRKIHALEVDNTKEMSEIVQSNALSKEDTETKLKSITKKFLEQTYLVRSIRDTALDKLHVNKSALDFVLEKQQSEGFDFTDDVE